MLAAAGGDRRDREERRDRKDRKEKGRKEVPLPRKHGLSLCRGALACSVFVVVVVVTGRGRGGRGSGGCGGYLYTFDDPIRSVNRSGRTAPAAWHDGYWHVAVILIQGASRAALDKVIQHMLSLRAV